MLDYKQRALKLLLAIRSCSGRGNSFCRSSWLFRLDVARLWDPHMHFFLPTGLVIIEISKYTHCSHGHNAFYWIKSYCLYTCLLTLLVTKFRSVTDGYNELCIYIRIMIRLQEAGIAKSE